MHLQTGEKGHLMFLHMGHSDFSDKLKPCCRDIPPSHLRLSEVFSVHAVFVKVDSSITVLPWGLGSWRTRVEKVSSETWVSPSRMSEEREERKKKTLQR